MNRKKLTGFRKASLDDEMVGILAGKHQIIRCCNGHMNQKNAKRCWRCGAWLNLNI